LHDVGGRNLDEEGFRGPDLRRRNGTKRARLHPVREKNSRRVLNDGTRPVAGRVPWNLPPGDSRVFLRFATEGDLNGILEIERLSFPIRKQWDRSDFQQAMSDLFLVSGEKEISGFLIACCQENERRAVIMRIAVHPDYRGRGIATILIEEAIDKIREMGIREVELDVDIVKRGAIQLYEAVGFKIARGIPMIDNNSMDDENGSYYMMKLVVNER